MNESLEYHSVLRTVFDETLGASYRPGAGEEQTRSRLPWYILIMFLLSSEHSSENGLLKQRVGCSEADASIDGLRDPAYVWERRAAISSHDHFTLW